MYYPDKTTFLKLAKKGNIVPVYRELIGDMETPVAMFQHILDKNTPGFLLESVEGGEHLGRYSFLGVNPAVIFKSKGKQIELLQGQKKKVWKTTSNPIQELRELMKQYKAVELKGLPRFSGGAVGHMNYRVAGFFEDLPDTNPDDLKLPDMYFMIADTMIIFDHIQHIIKVVSNVPITESPSKAYRQAIRKIEEVIKRISNKKSLPIVEMPVRLPAIKIKSNMTKNQFKKMVRKAKSYICRGDIIQTVLSQRFEVKLNCEPFSVYRALRSINPSPYMYCLKGKDFHIIGSSPELLVRCEGNMVETRPIAGTRPRGITPLQDVYLEKQLLANRKERAEHIMLVDLGRNDIGRVCRRGTVKVSELMDIERYSHVMHIVSNVIGKLRRDKDQFDVLAAVFPAGTVTGAPKIRAMEIIDELENVNRGPYAGAIGYFSFSGNLDTAITIRTVIVKDKTAYIQAGAGIVADSSPEKEYYETVNKAKGMLKAIQLAETF